MQPASSGAPDALDLGAVLDTLRRRARLIGLLFILTVVVAVGISLLQTKTYQAATTLRFRDPNVNAALYGTYGLRSSDPTRSLNATLQLAGTAEVSKRAAAYLNSELTPDQIGHRATVASTEDSDVFSVVAKDSDPRRAARVANAYAKAALAIQQEGDRRTIRRALSYVQQQIPQFERRLAIAVPGSHRAKQLQNAINQLEGQASDLRALLPVQVGAADIVSPAVVPSQPVSPKPKRNALVGGFIGLLLGVGVALGLEQLDRRLRSAEDAVEAVGVPLLGSVPRSWALDSYKVALEEPASPEPEAFRMIRANLRYFNAERDIKTLLVTSIEPGDGKSTVALNLAAMSAYAGEKAVLLEADVRHSSLARVFDLPPDRGLTTYLADRQAEMSDATSQVPIGPPSANGSQAAATLDVIPAGPTPPNPAELLGTDRMADLIARLREKYEFVMVDAPPLAVVADAIPLIPRIDGVLVVARVGENTVKAAEHLRAQLERLQAPVLGLVANFAPFSEYRYYSYYYMHGATSDAESAPAAKS